ncbi:MAG TPA: c-type cytochrome domain-containing protein, partial [Gemmataceae bacterium]|nr:c-type cytochrome domain-containing protein [Gemmataceae bacterium]
RAMKRTLFTLLALAALGLPAAAEPAKPATPAEAAEFFEKRVRPVLVENCQACHGDKKQRGGLRLDSRAALLKGGENGPAVAPGDPGKSRLIQAVRHAGDLKMPPKKQLPAEAVEALAAWVKMGAPWPETPQAAQGDPLSPAAARDRHWAFRPVRKPVLPAVRHEGWSARRWTASSWPGWRRRATAPPRRPTAARCCAASPSTSSACRRRRRRWTPS